MDKKKARENKEKRKKSIRSKNVMYGVVMGIIVIAIIGVLSSSRSFFSSVSKTSGTPTDIPTTAPTEALTPTPVPEPDLTAVTTINAVGDIILHQAVIDGGLQADGTYQYDYIFKHIASYLTQPDYTIANYEGALNGAPYSGYPMFNGPDAIAAALKNAGVDMVTTANNHSFDAGLAGLKRTPEVFKNAGVKVIGTRSSADDPKFQIVDLNGIKVGITGYTYETTGTETSKALNGMILPKEADDLVDSFNPYRAALYTKDMEEMAARIQAMKAAKAECILFVLHWGEEYKTSSNETQQKLAQYLSDQGVDVIIGHHPHVLQEISVITSAVSGKNTLVYYSVGNFLANMNFGTQGTNGYAQDAIIAKITIERSKAGVVRVTKGEYIDTFVNKDKTTAKTIHTIIPVSDALKSPEQYGMGKQTALLKDSAARTASVLSKCNGEHGSILIREYTP